MALNRNVLLVEALQGAIAGVGTLLTCAAMVRIVGPSRAVIFPALAPCLAALMAQPALGLAPAQAELLGLATIIAGLLWAVSGTRAT